MSFQNKTVIVTGGAKGIGYAIASKFSEQKANLFILDVNFSENFALNGSENIVCDITDFGSASQAVQSVFESTGRIDILVNNAGIIKDNVIWKMTEDEFDAVIAVNLKGSWLLCKEVAPIMRKQQSGRIINIASRAWLGNPGQSNYSASKGGLVSMTRVLALELASKNITVNAVAPGLIKTDMTESLQPEIFQKLLDKQPSKKAGLPEDIASAVTFLASENAGFINGQVLHVDGGRSIGSTIF
ncbi:MAG TPA: SDR family oxidoreductase [candidate division Zixibacteria bacterium]|nr:SDR family oxidoreductase [candidate division Zixibacteria bacterium]